MGKGRFLNQKLGKRMSRKASLDKARLESCHRQNPPSPPPHRLPKKVISRGRLPSP